MTAQARREIDELYRRHRDAVYRFVLRDTRDPDEAEDVTQTAFLQAYGSFLRGRRPDRPRTWLLAIADNLRRRRFSRARGRPREVTLAEDVAAADAPVVRELRDALGRLPPNQRSAFVLREVGGLSYAEIAQALDVSSGSVQMLLFRARRTLREELGTVSRRASSLLPSWLIQGSGHADRLVFPARAAGVALAVVAAVTVSTGAAPVPAGRGPAAPPVAELPAPGAVVGADLARGATPKRALERRMRASHPAEAAPVAVRLARLPPVPEGTRDEPAAPQPDVPKVSVAGIPELAAQELPSPAELPVPAPPLHVEVPLPELPPLPSLP